MNNNPAYNPPFNAVSGVCPNCKHHAVMHAKRPHSGLACVATNCRCTVKP
jgi:hypothetical protein